jgi:hypothetical protein
MRRDEMSKQFSEMTVTELRAYAEMVQAEYDAGEIEGPSGRQIVRDAWARVEEAEAVVEAEAPAVHTIKVIGIGMKQVKAIDVRSAIIKAVTKSRSKRIGVEYDAGTQIYTVTAPCGNARKVLGKVTVW